MEISETRQGAAMVLRVDAARIDAAAAIAFKDAVLERTAGFAGQVILDLAQVTFVDSSGLGAIVGAMKQMAPDRTLDLAGLTPGVAKVFRLTRMDTVFRIHGPIGQAGGLHPAA